MEIEQRIAEERDRTNALDASLDAQRTPYMKNQLRFAGHLLDDAVTALKHSAHATNSNDKLMWLSFAEMNIQHAIERREKVRAVVQKYSSPENVIEVGR